MPQGGTEGKVRIGTLRSAPCTLATLQMYSFCTGDQVLWSNETGPRGAVMCTARIAADSAFSLLTRPCSDLTAATRICALV